MQDRRSEIRMLCADLLEVWWPATAGHQRHQTALLEDISRSGACIQTEAPLPLGIKCRLRCRGDSLEGVVRYCVYREIGYFVGVEFGPDSKWSRQSFRPQHLLDLKRLVTDSS
jgi:hypothetical protein